MLARAAEATSPRRTRRIMPSRPSDSNATRLRVALLLGVVIVAGTVFVLQDVLPGRLRAGLGILCFLGTVTACSTDIRAINWRTVGWGLALQLALAVFILRLEVGGVRPGYEVFSALAAVVTRFLDFTRAGSEFVFGVLADPAEMSGVLPQRARARVRGPPDHHFRVVGVHRALSLRGAPGPRQDDGPADDAADGDEWSRNTVGSSQRVHGTGRRRRSSSSPTLRP